MPLVELLQNAGEGDFLRSVAEAVLQILMETDVEGLVGAGRYERNAERATGGTAFETARWIPASAHRSCASRSYDKTRISRHSSAPKDYTFHQVDVSKVDKAHSIDITGAALTE